VVSLVNTFGNNFRCTTFGESHGKALGVVIDGCPAGVFLAESDIQPLLDRRRPGQSDLMTQRKEEDRVEIVSGTFEGKTTGTPIALIIRNEDMKSDDYLPIRDVFRPGHADFTYQAKYGVRDYRGGGRSSARETAARVAAGAVARKVIPGVTIRGALVQIGPHRIDRARFDWAEVDRNPLFCPDAVMAEQWADYLDTIRKNGSSIGAVVEVVAERTW